ncbi:hypothetical protein AGR1C_pAt40266 [Agrobacterium fabacearum TT111]|nr:hypothetical protein AGR1C_pAt40266 [Agrobacterium fabacearum TT111]
MAAGEVVPEGYRASVDL